MRKRIRLTLNFYELLFLLFLLLHLVLQIINIPDAAAIYVPMLFGTVCYLFIYDSKKKFIVRKSSEICVFMTAFMLLSMIYNSNSRLYHLIYIWGCMGIAALIYCYKDRFQISWIRAMYFISAGVIICYSISGMSAGELFHNTSRNGVNSFIILYTVFVYLIYINEKQVPYIYALLSLVISIWSEGRSGIIVSLMMVVFIFIYNMGVHKGKKIRTVFFIAVISVVGYLFVAKYYRDNLYNISRVLKGHGLSTSRTQIWAEYIGILFENPWNILFGNRNIRSESVIIKSYAGNLHNSFFMIHSRYGLLPFCFVIWRLCVFVKKCLANRNYMLLILFVVIFTRSMFDWVAFPGVYDIMFYYFILYSYDKTNKRKLKEVPNC